MKRSHARLIVFFVGLPAIAALVIALPHFHHIGLNIAISATMVLGSSEVVGLFETAGIAVKRSLVVPLTAIVAGASYLRASEVIGGDVFAAALLLPFFVIVIAATVPSSRIDFSGALASAAGSFMAILYPAYFLSFLIRLSGLPRPSISILLFLSLVFANDTSAYVFGMFFGKSTRGITPISPNKSLPGFIAGPLFSVLIAGIFYWAVPELFGGKVLVAVAIGIAVGAATVIGDLFESVLKRSAQVKESGGLIPGRGGVLDSIDSVAFAAPLYFFLITLLG